MRQKKCSDNFKNVYALILAGGVGSRFWPFSRELEPKQFMKIIGGESLLQNTIKRLKGTIIPSHTYIVSNSTYYYELKKQTASLHIPESNLILEPEGKNTAPAIGLCAKLIEKKDKDAILAVFPADHFIKGEDKFKDCLDKAVSCAQEGFLVTIGIKPTKPSTGYGYVKTGLRVKGKGLSYFLVEKFLEKPNLSQARKYIADKNYYWNGGIFVWKVSVFLDELKKFRPDLYSVLSVIKDKDDIVKVWGRINPISVDYGIMEHSKKIALVPADFQWTDLGSWDALNEVIVKDSDGNIIQADSIDVSSKGICVLSRSNRLIGTIGLKDLVIADTPDALLVCAKERAQEVKTIVDKLKLSDRKEHIVHMTDKRPWGSYTILQVGNGFKIKLVEIDPYKRLSLQLHNKRAEHWVVVSGIAKVTCGSRVKIVRSNESIYIPRDTKHRLENPQKSPLKIVEVQTGSYLQEDDIERFEDDFRR